MRSPGPDDEEPPFFDALGSVSRLIAGLAIEGSLELLSILQEWKRENPPEQRVAQLNEDLSSAEMMRFVALGLVAETAQQTRKTAVRLTRLVSA